MSAVVSLTHDLRQSLTMSRQTIQAIEVLSLGQDELHEFLRDQAERNPLLRAEVSARSVGQPKLAMQSDRPSGLRAHDHLQQFVEARESLRSSLAHQLGLMGLSQEMLSLSCYIVDMLEPDGYLRSSLDSMADLLQCDPTALQEAHRIVTTLEPAGVGARSLTECLRLQLLDRQELDPVMTTLLDNLEMLVAGEVNRLARICRITTEELAVAMARLRRLAPFPGRAFDTEPLCPALPDLLVGENSDGSLRVELNPALLPKILIDKQYYHDLSGQLSQQQDRRYLSECLKNAKDIKRHVEQRYDTILLIAIAIVEHQKDFFRRGVKGLKPLSQKDIAREIGVHESTVSRAISGKNIMCSRGLISLKFFFSDRLSRNDGEGDVAAAAIRQRIKQLVQREDCYQIYSDDALVAKLALEGIEIARRTVAKYREQQGIPSSAERRRLMRLRVLA